jgi:predicted nuclease of restriction endonuclease-like RecB superfamily
MPKPAEVAQRVTIPSYLGPHDHPWLLALIEEYQRFAGRRRAELTARLREPLRVQCPADRLELARKVMDRICLPNTRSPLPPPNAREAVFCAAADRRARGEALRDAAAATGVKPDELLSAMFADLPDEKLLPPPPADLNPVTLALRANLALVGSWFARATRVEIALAGNARDIVRYALLRGLLCVVRGDPNGSDGLVLEISGPLSLFRSTLVYGRTLASLVPRLAHCDRFELQAFCVVNGQQTVICVRSGDPIFPSDPPRRFDSKLEQRFVRDFGKAAPDWNIVREPAPIEADGTLIFPDFELVHRRNERQRAWLEIIGFWTPTYLTDKLRRLRAARLERLILCIDASLNCGDRELPGAACIVRFKRRIDPRLVLDLLEARNPSTRNTSGTPRCE